MKKGDLRVWWIPQIPMTPFHFIVLTWEEGGRLLRALAAYDLFQLKHRIKPDFANTGGLEMWNGSEWEEWEDSLTGDSIDEVIKKWEEAA